MTSITCRLDSPVACAYIQKCRYQLHIGCLLPQFRATIESAFSRRFHTPRGQIAVVVKFREKIPRQDILQNTLGLHASTKANRVHSPAGSPDFRKWGSCRTMPLVDGFSRGSPGIRAVVEQVMKLCWCESAKGRKKSGSKKGKNGVGGGGGHSGWSSRRDVLDMEAIRGPEKCWHNARRWHISIRTGAPAKVTQPHLPPSQGLPLTATLLLPSLPTYPHTGLEMRGLLTADYCSLATCLVASKRKVFIALEDSKCVDSLLPTIAHSLRASSPLSARGLEMRGLLTADYCSISTCLVASKRKVFIALEDSKCVDSLLPTIAHSLRASSPLSARGLEMRGLLTADYCSLATCLVASKRKVFIALEDSKCVDSLLPTIAHSLRASSPLSARGLEMRGLLTADYCSISTCLVASKRKVFIALEDSKCVDSLLPTIAHSLRASSPLSARGLEMRGLLTADYCSLATCLVASKRKVFIALEDSKCVDSLLPTIAQSLCASSPLSARRSTGVQSFRWATRLNSGETGDPRENPPTSGIVRHDSHLKKSRVNRPDIEPGSPWWEASSLTAHPVTTLEHKSHRHTDILHPLRNSQFRSDVGIAPPVTTASPDVGIAPPVPTVSPDVGIAPSVTTVSPDVGIAPSVTTVSPDVGIAPPIPTVSPDVGIATPVPTVSPDVGIAPPVTTVSPDVGIAPSVTTVSPDVGIAPSVTTVSPDVGIAPSVTTVSPDVGIAPPIPTVSPDVGIATPVPTVSPDVGIATPVPTVSPDVGIEPSVTTVSPDVGIAPSVTTVSPDVGIAPPVTTVSPDVGIAPSVTTV
ncbi:hypothetical protein PR048_014185 [Dryococelus australis]|uniref:Uncharacterized protein n=1 Tax=Dryococelus australis TaxID=614101 RepID=A0ABQ9HDH8_9NEOP|nr:hypothetical protein PR048_014185 [Dryococelus australis]